MSYHLVMAKGDSLRVIEGGADASSVASMDASGTVASGESEHALLAAGKIDVEEFIEMSVDRALSHLQGQISAGRLEQMREVLRAQLESDPHLASLIERAASGE